MTQKIIVVTVRTKPTATVERAQEEHQTIGKVPKKGGKRPGRRRGAMRVAGYIALGVLGVILFRAGAAHAEAARGYRALGGEVFALLLPALFYVAYRTLGDLFRDLRETVRRK